MTEQQTTENDQLRQGIERIIRDVQQTIDMARERDLPPSVDGPTLLTRLHEVLAASPADFLNRVIESSERHVATPPGEK